MKSRFRDEHLLNGVRMVDQEAGERAQVHRHDIAVRARAPGVET
jgi:hypothetical protein